MEAALPNYISVEDYLRYEQLGDIRHEYIGGELYAMAGASEEHGIISLNLAIALRQHLGTGPCKVFIADMKVRLEIARDDILYYPDVLVTCDPADTHRFYKTRPQIIAEILSPDTERKDRREKFLSYTRLPSLQEYLLVSQNEPTVTLFRRSREWAPEFLMRRDTLSLPSIELSVPVADLFAGLTFPRPA